MIDIYIVSHEEYDDIVATFLGCCGEVVSVERVDEGTRGEQTLFDKADTFFGGIQRHYDQFGSKLRIDQIDLAPNIRVSVDTDDQVYRTLEEFAGIMSCILKQTSWDVVFEYFETRILLVRHGGKLLFNEDYLHPNFEEYRFMESIAEQQTEYSFVDLSAQFYR